MLIITNLPQQDRLWT